MNESALASSNFPLLANYFERFFAIEITIPRELIFESAPNALDNRVRDRTTPETLESTKNRISFLASCRLISLVSFRYAHRETRRNLFRGEELY